MFQARIGKQMYQPDFVVGIYHFIYILQTVTWSDFEYSTVG